MISTIFLATSVTKKLDHNNQTEVYSGCYGRISVNFYGYNSNGNRGVAAGLGNIQKLKDGEALSSRTNAEDDFEVVEDEDFLG